MNVLHQNQRLKNDVYMDVKNGFVGEEKG